MALKNVKLILIKVLQLYTFDDIKIDKNKLASFLSKNTDNMYKIIIEENESTQSWWYWIFGG